MSKEAMKLALEALENSRSLEPVDVQWVKGKRHAAITALREALAEQPAQQDSTCSNALRIQHKAYPRTCKKCGLGPCVELAQQALDKKAENARELGLDYEPAQQEPLQNNPFDCGVYLGSGKDHVIKHRISHKPAQQESVGYVAENGVVDWNGCAPPIMTDLYTSPPQRKPLTDEEIGKAWSVADGEHNASASVKRRITRAIEAAHGIKEKNNG